MKVLLVNSYYKPEVIGGAEKSVQKLAEELQNRGNEVEVLCSYSENVVETINNIKVIRMRPNNMGRRYDLQFQINKFHIIKRCFYKVLFKTKLIYLLDTINLFNYGLIRKHISEFNPDIIHTNGLYEITPIVWIVAKNKGIRVVHTLRDYYLLCIYGNLKDRGKGKTCSNPRFLCKLRRMVNKGLLNYVDCLTSPSESTGDIIEKNTKKKVYTIYNAIDFSLDEVSNIREQKKKLFSDKLEFNLVYIGSLSEFKGVDWLLKKFVSLRRNDVQLHLAGDGPLADMVKEYSKKYENITYHGFLSEDKLNELLIQCDILVCPSMWPEPFGRIVLDAYKNVMPVITTGFGGLGEIVDDRITGYILDLDKDDSFEQALSYYLDDKERMFDAFDSVVEKLKIFSIENQVNQFMNLYSK